MGQKIKTLLKAYRGGIGLLGLISVAIVALWLIGAASVAVFDYVRLNASTHVNIYAWEVAELESDAFAVSALYAFDANGTRYEASSVVPDIVYRNQWAAEPHLQELSGREWKVWYSRSNPEISSLYKSFPTKKVVYAFLTLVVLIYFVYIKKYLVEVAK